MTDTGKRYSYKIKKQAEKLAKKINGEVIIVEGIARFIVTKNYENNNGRIFTRVYKGNSWLPYNDFDFINN